MAEVLSKKCEELGEHDFLPAVTLSRKEKSLLFFGLMFDSSEADIGAVSVCRRCGAQNRFWMSFGEE